MVNQTIPVSDPTADSASSSELPADLKLDAAAVAAFPEETYEAKKSQAGEERVFEINVSKSIHDHERYIREQPMFGPWKPAPQNSSFMSRSLRELIPSSLISRGLADWTTASQKHRREHIEEQMNIPQSRSHYPFSIAFREQENHRALFAKELPEAMESLSEYSKNARLRHHVNMDGEES